MTILKKIIQMTLFLVGSLILHILPWIPSLMVENIVNTTIILFYIIAGFFVYQIISFIYHTQEEKHTYKNTLYTFLLLAYMGAFAILQIGISFTKSTYVNTYTFDNKTFYLYTEHNTSYEVSLKDKRLPIRTLPVVRFPYTKITLEKRDRYIYAIGKGIDKKIYDLKENQSFIQKK